MDVEGRKTAANGELRLVKKHPRAIRWMHWVNFPLLAIMIWSGLLIYWGDSIPPYQHAHEVYRIGIGHWTLVRFFPDWFWKLLDAPYQITTGLGWHFFVMWLFAVNGIAYAIYLAVSGEWRVLWPKRKSFVDAMWVTLYDLHVPAARRRGMPPQGKYNGAQRIAYSAIVLMGAGSLLSGLAIYKPAQLHWLTTALGGYEMARWEHFWLMMGFCGFFVVHVVQVVMAGWNNFRSMVSGAEIQRIENRDRCGRLSVDRMSEFDQEREIEIVRGDAGMVRRESAKRTRRSFLVGGIAAAAGYAAWRAIDQSAEVGRLQTALRDVINGDAAVSRAVFRERGLSPTYPLSRAVPLRLNGVIGMEQMLVPASWRLQVTGARDAQQSRFYVPDVTAWEYGYTGASAMDMMPDLKSGRAGAVQSKGAPSVQMPEPSHDLSANTPTVNGLPHVDIAARFNAMAQAISGKRRMGTAEAGASASSLNIGTPGLLLTMDELRKLPHVELVTEFKCIEGWSQITQWAGVRLRDFIDAFPPAPVNGRAPRYVYMETPDGDYYCGYDMAAARHPQSTLVMEMSGRPLLPEHGAPLRLHMPIKYGYKQIKRIGLIAYTDVKPDDFWTKLGYDWYAGL